jgi:hypothetical protein
MCIIIKTKQFRTVCSRFTLVIFLSMALKAAKLNISCDVDTACCNKWRNQVAPLCLSCCSCDDAICTVSVKYAVHKSVLCRVACCAARWCLRCGFCKTPDTSHHVTFNVTSEPVTSGLDIIYHAAPRFRPTTHITRRITRYVTIRASISQRYPQSNSWSYSYYPQVNYSSGYCQGYYLSCCPQSY